MMIVYNINRSIRKLLHKTYFKDWPYREKVDIKPEELKKEGFTVPRVRFRFFHFAPRSNCKNSRIELLKVQWLVLQHLRVVAKGYNINICALKEGNYIFSVCQPLALC